MPSPELKPCPFCGGPAEIGTYSIDGYTTAWTGTCKDNQCNGYCIADYFRSAHSLREAVAAWNRRAGEEGK